MKSNLAAFSNYQDSKAKNKVVTFEIKYSAQNRKFSIETLKQEIRSVLMENFELE